MARKLSLYPAALAKETARFHYALGRRWQRQRRARCARFTFQWRGTFAECAPMTEYR